MSSSAPCTEELKRENTQLTKKLLAAKDELLAAKDKIIALHEENKRLAESVSAVVTPTEARRDNAATCHLGQTCEWCYRLWCRAVSVKGEG